MTKPTMSAADQQYMDEYFITRRAKEVRKLIIAVVAMVAGVPISGFAEDIASYLDVAEGLVSVFGLLFNLCGFFILASWIMDGKEYVFPRKPAKVGK